MSKYEIYIKMSFLPLDVKGLNVRKEIMKEERVCDVKGLN